MPGRGRGRRLGRATPRVVVRLRHRRPRRGGAPEAVQRHRTVRNLAVVVLLRGRSALKPVLVVRGRSVLRPVAVLGRSVAKPVPVLARWVAKAAMLPRRLARLRRAGPVARLPPGLRLRLPRAEQRQQRRAVRAARLRAVQMVAEATGLRPSQDPASARS